MVVKPKSPSNDSELNLCCAHLLPGAVSTWFVYVLPLVLSVGLRHMNCFLEKKTKTNQQKHYKTFVVILFIYLFFICLFSLQ